jgi:hypothetical protein
VPVNVAHPLPRGGSYLQRDHFIGIGCTGFLQCAWAAGKKKPPRKAVVEGLGGGRDSALSPPSRGCVSSRAFGSVS